MGKPKEIEAPPVGAPGEFESLTWPEWQALPEDVRMRRAQRALEKLRALRGKIHLNIDIDELRGRNR